MAADMPPAAAKVPFHLWSQWAHWKEIVSSGAFWEGLQLAQHGSPVYPSTNFCAQRSGILWLAALTTCLPANLWELGIENPLTEITWNRPAFFKKKKALWAKWSWLSSLKRERVDKMIGAKCRKGTSREAGRKASPGIWGAEMVPRLGRAGSREAWKEGQQRARTEAKSQSSSWSNYHATKNLICTDIFLITGRKDKCILRPK